MTVVGWLAECLELGKMDVPMRRRDGPVEPATKRTLARLRAARCVQDGDRVLGVSRERNFGVYQAPLPADSRYGLNSDYHAKHTENQPKKPTFPASDQ